MELFLVETPPAAELRAAEALATLPQFEGRGLSLLYVNSQWVLQEDDTEAPGHPEQIAQFFMVPTPEAVETVLK